MVLNNKRVLVIGAQGVLGAFCARALRELGYTVFSGGSRHAAYTFKSVGVYLTTIACTILIIEKLLQVVQTRPDLKGIHLFHHLLRFDEFRDQCAERGIYFR